MTKSSSASHGLLILLQISGGNPGLIIWGYALPIHRFQKKPEVTPKRGLIALAEDTQSNKHGERRGKASLSSDNIPGVSVNEELTD